MMAGLVREMTTQVQLGDWTPNSRKLPNGIAGIADKIKESGLKILEYGLS